MSSKSTMKLGMGQLLVEGGEPDRNLERAGQLIQEAYEDGCDLVLLPETIDFAWTHPSSLSKAREIPGVYSDLLCDLARQYGLFIGAGLSEKRDQRHFNTAILIDPGGEIVLKYSKINLLEVEFPYYEVGSSLGVVDTGLGRIGLNICADNYIESLHIGQTLACMGAQLILSPSSWTVDYNIDESCNPYGDKWTRPLRHIAYYYDVIIVSTTSVGYIVGGPYEGRKMVGCSLAVGPGGIIAKGRFNEFAGELISCELDIPEKTARGTQIGDMVRRKGYDFERSTL